MEHRIGKDAKLGFGLARPSNRVFTRGQRGRNRSLSEDVKSTDTQVWPCGRARKSDEEIR